MTRSDIIKMAKEAGFETAHDWVHYPNGFVVIVERFAALVAAAEREACAMVCEDIEMRNTLQGPADCAAAIRERKA